MSAEALNWVKPRRTGATGRKATLLVVADVANHHGVVFASVEYLAGVLECSRDTVITHLKRLEVDGHLERIRRWRVDGAPTSSLTVLGLRCDDRGSMLPATADDQNGLKIAAHLERAPKSRFSPPKSENPTSGSSEPKSGSTPVQVGIPDSTRPFTRQLDPSLSSAARESSDDRTEKPTSGDDLGELIAYLDGVARWANTHDDKDVRRFASVWLRDGSEPRRIFDLLKPEVPAVRLIVVDYVARRARAGWTTNSVAHAIAGRVLTNAREEAAAADPGVKSRDERKSDHADVTARRMASAQALANRPAAPQAPDFDFDAAPNTGDVQ